MDDVKVEGTDEEVTVDATAPVTEDATATVTEDTTADAPAEAAEEVKEA